MLFNLFGLEECYISINNSSNMILISILETNYNQNLGLKSKDSKELTRNPRLIKETF